MNANATPPPDTNEAVKRLEQEIRRSSVRINVTYLVVAVYSVSALMLIVYFMSVDKVDQMLGVFSSVAAASGTIVGFWFGARGLGGLGETPPTDMLANPSAKPTIESPKPIVSEVQKLLVEFSALIPDASLRLRDSLIPGVVDGLLGPSTLAAIDNFLVLLSPPTRYADLEEPRLETVRSQLKAEIKSRSA